MNNFEKILVFSSGANWKILSRTKNSIPRYRHLGFSNITNSISIILLFTWGFNTVYKNEIISTILGLLLGGTIYFFNLVSLKYFNKTNNKSIYYFLIILMGIIGLLISLPLNLLIFKDILISQQVLNSESTLHLLPNFILSAQLLKTAALNDKIIFAGITLISLITVCSLTGLLATRTFLLAKDDYDEVIESIKYKKKNEKYKEDCNYLLEAKQYISQNETNKVMEYLIRYSKNTGKYNYYNEILILKAQLEMIEKEKRTGQIAIEDFSIRMNRINYGVSEIIDKMIENVSM